MRYYTNALPKFALPAHNAGGQDSHSYWSDHAGSRQVGMTVKDFLLTGRSGGLG